MDISDNNLPVDETNDNASFTISDSEILLAPKNIVKPADEMNDMAGARKRRGKKRGGGKKAAAKKAGGAPGTKPKGKKKGMKRGHQSTPTEKAVEMMMCDLCGHERRRM